ncbi:MAG TPA: ABC transporter substrate-binding protein [Streptosporangiaceae bacterium]|nr:ABC transporter substrate-binding protein [Streptosporangiaceae bacterium]
MRTSYVPALAGIAALALLSAGCSSSSSSGSGGYNWSNATSAASGGGMAALVKAAKAEGTLNVIALPADWANYGTIIKDFTAKYGIKVNSIAPTDSSAQEVTQIQQKKGTSLAADVLDVGGSVAAVSTTLFAPYKVATWSSIPAALKNADGLYTGDYGGYMSVGYDSAKFGTITSLSQLLGPKFKHAVALNGNPTQAAAAFSGVLMASLANGGSASDIAPGVSFFHKLNQAGNFNTVQATPATIKTGATPVVFNWDYLNTASVVGQSATTWKLFIPSNAVLGGFYYQAINKNAPHPAAARLWEEFLFSQGAVGGQNLWLEGGARPSEQIAMTSNGSIDKAAAAALPAVAGTPVIPTQAQNTTAADYLSANWAKAVS